MRMSARMEAHTTRVLDASNRCGFVLTFTNRVSLHEIFANRRQGQVAYARVLRLTLGDGIPSQCYSDIPISMAP